MARIPRNPWLRLVSLVAALLPGAFSPSVTHGAESHQTTYLQNLDLKALAVDDLKLYDAWFEQRIFNDQASVLLGIHDLNSEFYVTDTASSFLHPAFGVGTDLSQSGIMGPSIFPYATTALRLKFEPTSHLRLQSAAFNAVAGDPEHPSQSNYSVNAANGLLIISEVAYADAGDAPYKYGLGYWKFTKSAESPRSGFYLLAEQAILPNVNLFVRFGAADRRPEVKYNLSGGIVSDAIWASRPNDRAGLGVTHAASSEHGVPGETAYELFYRIAIHAGLYLQPDLQFVQHAGFSPQSSTACAGSLRLEASF
jgi:porin